MRRASSCARSFLSFASSPITVLALSLSACGGGRDDGGADGGVGPGGGGSGGGGNGAGVGVCEPPAGATVLLDWAVRDREDGSPVYQLAVQGDYLYVQHLDNIERVPVTGGPAERVFDNRAEIPITTPFWLRDDGQLLVIDGEGPVLVPEGGGAPTPVMVPDDAWFASPFGMGNPYDRSTDTLYGARFTSESGTQKTTYFAIDLDAGTQTIIAADLEVEDPGSFDFSDGVFAYQPSRNALTLQTTRDAGATWQAADFSAPAGTTATFARLHEGSAWFVVSNFDPPFNGIARAPVAGGALTLVVDDYVFLSGLRKSPGYVGVNTAEELWAVPTAGGEPTHVPLAIGTDCTSHEIGIGGGRAFSSFYRSDTGETLVFSVPL
jgi:hypothetical protein